MTHKHEIWIKNKTDELIHEHKTHVNHQTFTPRLVNYHTVPSQVH